MKTVPRQPATAHTMDEQARISHVTKLLRQEMNLDRRTCAQHIEEFYKGAALPSIQIAGVSGADRRITFENKEYVSRDLNGGLQMAGTADDLYYMYPAVRNPRTLIRLLALDPSNITAMADSVAAATPS